MNISMNEVFYNAKFSYIKVKMPTSAKDILRCTNKIVPSNIKIQPVNQ